MLESSVYEQVTQIRMGRELNGSVLYWVSAYLVDGLLIDTGCSFTSAELVEFLRGKNLTRAVNTHFHEDHVGGNRAVMEGWGIEIHAHKDSVPLMHENRFSIPTRKLSGDTRIPSWYRHWGARCGPVTMSSTS